MSNSKINRKLTESIQIVEKSSGFLIFRGFLLYLNVWIGYRELKTYLDNESLLQNTYIKILDSEYFILLEHHCSDVLKVCPKLPYIKDRRDCDDFGIFMLNGELGKRGYGNISVGALIFKSYDVNGETIVHHGVNLFVYKDQEGRLKSKIGEPQSLSLFWNLDESMPGKAGIVKTEYTDLYI